MCFSATASFTASAVLTAVGVQTVRKVKQREDRFLAALPLMFGIQQFFEGLVWILPSSSWISLLAAYGFLFFAFVVWPFYLPFSVFMGERVTERKQILRVFIIIGLVGSAYAIMNLAFLPLGVQQVANSIQYCLPVPEVPVLMIAYVLVTVGSLLLSSRLFIQLFGIVCGLSAWISWYFYTNSFTSVWCFFSAVLSLMLFFYFVPIKFGKKRVAKK